MVMEPNTICVRHSRWAVCLSTVVAVLTLCLIVNHLRTLGSLPTLFAQILSLILSLGTVLLVSWCALCSWRFRILVHGDYITIRPALGRQTQVLPGDPCKLLCSTGTSSRPTVKFCLVLNQKKIWIPPDMVNFPHLAAYFLRLRRHRKLSMDRKTADLLEHYRTTGPFGKPYPNPPEI